MTCRSPFFLSIGFRAVGSASDFNFKPFKFEYAFPEPLSDFSFTPVLIRPSAPAARWEKQLRD